MLLEYQVGDLFRLMAHFGVVLLVSLDCQAQRRGEVQGGTFTITNHGGMGSLFSTPIINQPQIAILGVGATQKRAVVINDAIVIRPMAYLSLSFDHRVIDGATADRFMARVRAILEESEWRLFL